MEDYQRFPRRIGVLWVLSLCAQCFFLGYIFGKGC